MDKPLSDPSLIENKEDLQKIPLWLFSMNPALYTRDVTHSYVMEHLQRFVLGKVCENKTIASSWDEYHAAFVRVVRDEQTPDQAKPSSIAAIKGGQRIFALFFYAILCHQMDLELLPHMAALIAGVPSNVIKDSGLVGNTFNALGGLILYYIFFYSIEYPLLESRSEKG